tara:strand:+ start:1128 stop:1721 length:594 start_codon:yes stop_codon:yes gene_type:complete
MKVILVGNGSSVLDKELGEYIDSEFDLVYRINRFKTIGFEEYVGKKVDGWFLADTGTKWLTNPLTTIEGSMRFKEFKYVFICMPKFKHNPNGLPLTDTVQLLPSEIEDRINENINFSPHWPTSGLIAIEFLLQNYDEIYIHGFDSKSKKYEYIHYYDKGDEDRLTEKWHRPRIDHNIELEKKYLNQLRKQKKVIDIV